MSTEAPEPREEASFPKLNPWLFVPTLYFLQGVPVVIVQQMSVPMYKTMGVDNAQIGLWTSLIAWPWIVKMLWGPLVDTNGTKRGWIVAMQALIFLGLAGAAFGITQSAFLAITLAIFFGVAFLSATHDIAADGFYLLALPERLQAYFVGIRSAFFRLAMIFSTGVLVVIAGNLEKSGTPTASAWMTALGIGAGLYGLFALYNAWALPKPEADRAVRSFQLGSVLGRFGQVVLMLVALVLVGRFIVIGASQVNRITPSPVFTKSVELTPLFVESYAGQTADARASMAQEEFDKIVRKRELASAGATETPSEAITLEAQRAEDEAAAEKAAAGRPAPFPAPGFAVPYLIQALISIMVIGIGFVSTRNLFNSIGMAPAAKEYFSQKKIVAILSFILLYRFGESLIVKMSAPFLLDPADRGGLGVGTDQVGLITGTYGVVGLTLGGLLGGVVISKYGIKKSIWPMVLALNIPSMFYAYAAFAKPALSVVAALITIDQFGYGFGFAAYMVYLMFISQGAKLQTSHYAISTGLMALGAMVAGILSGFLQEYFASAFPGMGYAYFFVAAVILSVPGMITLLFIPMDKEDMNPSRVEID